MFKKIIIAVSTVALSSTVMADTPVFNGTITSGNVSGVVLNEYARTALTFNCAGEDDTHIDLCINTDLQMVRQNSNIMMEAHIDPSFAETHKRIYMSYTFNKYPAQGDYTDRLVHVFARNGADTQDIFVKPFEGNPVTVVRYSSDGGITWTPPTVLRPQQ